MNSEKKLKNELQLSVNSEVRFLHIWRKSFAPLEKLSLVVYNKFEKDAMRQRMV